MPHALILNTASKATTTGGTFADTLTANSGDSLAVANYDSGGARILEAWGMDSAHAMEVQWIYTRPESTHDQSHGWRTEVPALFPGGAGNVGAHNLLPGYAEIPVFKSDSATIQVTSTANDNCLVSWVTEYDDLPGVAGTFASWDQVKALRKSTIGVQCSPVASGTAGLYGTSRAINADDDRFHADSYYAILGISSRIPACTVTFTGPDWGGQRIGCPAGVLDMRGNVWFLEQSLKYGKPMIPYFSSNNKGNVLLQVADSTASTSPILDIFCIELSARPS